MKTITYFFLILTGVLFSNCATIVGGQKYYAHVVVKDKPNAAIFYNGIEQGKGNARFKVHRKAANTFSIEVREESCESETFNFNQRVFRGWSLVGTIVLWTGFYIVPLPWGVMVDGITGAWWKPDKMESNVTKIDFKNYTYNLPYIGCESGQHNQYYGVWEEEKKKEEEKQKTKADRLREIKKLFDEGVLTESEYNDEKAKILAED